MDYREKIVHGDEGLPFAVYSVTPSHARYHMELHWHPEHEILFVQDGTFSLRLNDTVYLLHPGDVVADLRRHDPLWRAGGVRLHLLSGQFRTDDEKRGRLHGLFPPDRERKLANPAQTQRPLPGFRYALPANVRGIPCRRRGLSFPDQRADL